jgi:glycosyltransferase involved in cell wall biosynthesis
MQDPRVSIITPVYNGVRTIAETIESLLAQTESAWEQIIVDDGSTDATGAVVKRFPDARILYHCRPHAGLSAARNTGMDLGRGEFLLFLDADDWLLPNALRDRLAFMDQHPEYGVCISDGYFATEEGDEIVSFSERREEARAGDVLSRLVIDSSLLGAPVCAFIRRDIVRKHRLRFSEDLKMGEDWFFMIEAARHTHFGFLSVPTCKYRWHRGNMSRSADEEHRKNQFWLGRQKVMEAPYFDMLPVPVRRHFFYQLLIDLLGRRPEEQAGVIHGAPFSKLPPPVQASLIRLVAGEYLLSEDFKTALRFLRCARDMGVPDPKRHLLQLLFSCHPRAARLALRGWRAFNCKPGASKLQSVNETTDKHGNE